MLLGLAGPARLVAQEADSRSVMAEASVSIPRILRLRSAEVRTVAVRPIRERDFVVAVTLYVVANVGYRLALHSPSPMFRGSWLRLSDSTLVPLGAGEALDVGGGAPGRTASVVYLELEAGAETEAPMTLVAEAVPLSGAQAALARLVVRFPPPGSAGTVAVAAP